VTRLDDTTRWREPGTPHYPRRPDTSAPRSIGNGPRTVARPDGATLAVPAGFRATLIASGLTHPRHVISAGPEGTLLLAQSSKGEVTLVRGAVAGATEETVTTSALIPAGRLGPWPHGLAIHGGHLYVSDLSAVWRVPYAAASATADLDRLEQITAAADFAVSGGGHVTRNVAVNPRDGGLFVSFGSESNDSPEAEPRATVREFDAAGKLVGTFASGLRNPVEVKFHPDTGELFTVVNERDGLGDGLVPDFMTHLERGAFYGWPYAYIGANKQPNRGGRDDLVAQSLVPDLLFQSHSAPISFDWYPKGQGPFPERYRGGAFVALKGSWNSSRPVGYFVAFVPFGADGRPAGSYSVFAAGFRTDDGEGAAGEPAEVWGRPAGVAVTEEGALVVADETGKTLWLVDYVGGDAPPATSGPPAREGGPVPSGGRRAWPLPALVALLSCAAALYGV